MDIYLDYAATAPCHPLAQEALNRYFKGSAGNPSSPHSWGRIARRFLEDSREAVADRLGCKIEEVIFTSGATESNNLAVLGGMGALPSGSTFLCSRIEHPSVYSCLTALSERGYLVKQIPVGRTGIVDIAELKNMVEGIESGLVSVMAVNNEIGTVQPLDEIAVLTKERGLLLHVDGVQALPGGRLEALDKADFLSLSGHKLGGLFGAGVLVKKNQVSIKPILYGGAQENYRRPGTPPLPAIVTLGAVLSRPWLKEADKLLRLRDKLETLLAKIPGACLIGDGVERAAHISSWLFSGIRAEVLLAALDLRGICVSSGSACSSHSVEPSRVLQAMGFSREDSFGLIRFSLGWKTTEEEIERCALVVREVVEAILRGGKG